MKGGRGRLRSERSTTGAGEGVGGGGNEGWAGS